MLKDFDLLNNHEVVIVGCHAQHHAVLNIQGDLASISVLPAIVQPFCDHSMWSIWCNN